MFWPWFQQQGLFSHWYVYIIRTLMFPQYRDAGGYQIGHCINIKKECILSISVLPLGNHLDLWQPYFHSGMQVLLYEANCVVYTVELILFECIGT